MAENSGVLVLGGHHRNALGIVRHLSARGIPVAVGSDRRFAPARWSRFACWSFTYRPVESGATAAHEDVLAAIERWRPAVLLPTMDETWRLVYTFYSEYSQLTRVVPCPGRRTFERMLDKKLMTEQARSCGVDTPWTWCPRSPSEALAASDTLPFPVLLKPSASTGGHGIRRVERPSQLPEALGHFEQPPLIQEVVTGQDLELTLLCIRGRPLAGSTYVSLRNSPLPYGPPAACRTMRDDDLIASGVRLLEALQYHGVAHLDFRRDQRDGKPKLLDFNARLAGTDEISTVSGVNFSLLLYRLALGTEPDRCFDGRPDVEFRWLSGEIRHLLASSQKLRDAKALLRWRGVSTNFWFTDPLPTLAQVVDVAARS